MRLHIELPDTLIVELTVPGSHTPDVLNDVATRAIDVLARSIAIMRAYEPDEGQG